VQRHASAPGPLWRSQEHRIELRGATYGLRLTQFPAGWLASVDTLEGPTLGCNASPYLAVSRAIEPVDGRLIDALSIVSTMRPSQDAAATSSIIPSLMDR
jgi:hypothetical protein